MRLDHLLSKEHLQQPAWMYVRVWGLSGSKPVAQAIVLRRVLMGGISTNSGRCVVVSFPSTNPGGSGTVGVVMWWFSCLAHCWVLRQQDHGFAVFAFRGVGGVLVGLFVSGFPAMTVHARVCGVCGVGLLFENYIVDASILYKKQFPRI